MYIFIGIILFGIACFAWGFTVAPYVDNYEEES